MKKIILSLTLSTLGTLTYAQGLDSIIVEKYYISNAADATGSIGVLPAGSVTYRVYVDLQPGYSLQALYGTENQTVTPHIPLHTLLINTSTSFFNNEDRGTTNANGIGSQYMKNNTVALDSWFSVGAAATGQMGVMKTEDNGAANLIFPHTPTGLLTNTTTATGIALATQDGMIAGSPVSVTFIGTNGAESIFDATSQAGNSFSISNGSVAALGGSKGPDSSTFNRVLVGQFTTDGIFHFELNIQIGHMVSGIAVTESYVAHNPTGSEISVPSLIYTSTSASSNVPPTINITAPVTAATYTTGATVAIAATATDTDGTIDSVAFFVDGVRIGKDISSPYTSNYISTVGTHTLTSVATDNSGAHTTSSAIIIVVSNPVGINELSISNSLLTVYPNPTNDFITIEINIVKESVATYSIYDINGNLILNKKLGEITGNYQEKINVSSFTSGQYILELSLDGAISTNRIIKN